MYMEVLTEQDYRIADENGIERLLVYRRVNECGWSVERAITEDVNEKHRPTGAWDRWKEIAEENGVSHQLFRTRLSRGKTEEEAAFEPPRKPRGRVIAKDVLDIPYLTARRAMDCGVMMSAR